VAGPTIGTVADAVELWQGLAHGEPKAADALRFAVNNTPFANLFWVRPALDHLILNDLQEMVSPGVFERRERDMMKDYGQRYLVSP